MNTNNNLSESLLESSEIASYPILSTQSSSQQSMFSNLDWKMWLIIILVLALLGLNIFVYLAQGTETLASLIKKMLNYFGIVTGDVVNVTAEGTKMALGTTVDVIDTGLTKIQELTPQGRELKKGSVEGTQLYDEDGILQQTPMDISQLNTLNKALNSSTAQVQRGSGGNYSADDSTSNIQSGTSKSGWCYIGKEAGYRTCAKVGVNDTCMSGDIFPTHEICVNPNLRA
jgi:hypothetical protein